MLRVHLFQVDFIHILSKRRDALSHTEEELRFLANGAAAGTIPDYQLSAWLMAAYLNPLSEQETVWLTLAMAQSGERIDLTGLPKPWMDKHSTGGVGDKTTIVLLPVLAACGLTVVKMSGRGLGITGGTVDKLMSVPGFRMDLTPEEMKVQASKIGLAITGSTPNLAPADKTLYALRDVTGTVRSLPLIVSSILSKKIAGGAEIVTLDVKCGSGAFMKTPAEARQLATWLKKIGESAGLNVQCEITEMDQPLGWAIGNALEVKEAIRVLKGDLDGRFAELCIEVAASALKAGNRAEGLEQGRVMVREVLRNGAAFAKAKEWFAAQGGDVSVFSSEDWGVAPAVFAVRAKESGWVARVDAEIIGQAVVDLGGGRKKKTDEIDPRVGVVLRVEVGKRVAAGDVLAEVHYANENKSVIECIEHAIQIVDHGVRPLPIVLARDSEL